MSDVESPNISDDDHGDQGLAGDGPAETLAELGISELQGSVYRWLLRQRCSTVAELARCTSQRPDRVASALAALHRLKFVNPDANMPDTWVPELPHIAVETLAMQRQAALLATRLVIPGLEREVGRVPGSDAVNEENGVARVPGTDPANQVRVYLQLQQQARRTVCIVARPPYLVVSPEHMSAARRAARERGVRYRSILDAESITLPGWNDTLCELISAGEEMRVLGSLPFKLMLADDDCALLPADLLDQRGDALLVRSTSLLHALRDLFDKLWALSVPLVLDAAGAPALRPQTESLDTALVSLLAAGGNDKSVAAQMGLSHRTLMRRVKELYKAVNAQSRFQAGWLAAHQMGSATGHV